MSQIDIVIVNCNNGENLKSCIKGIKQNTSGRYRLIVVDQNSKDGTREWLLDNVGHVILDKKRLGRGDGKNKGLRVCQSEWIALIDPDTLIQDPTWLDKMWNYIVDKSIGIIEAKINVNQNSFFSALSFTLLRRECLNEVGYFDVNISRLYEYDWLARLELTKWKTGFCFDTIVANATGRGMAGSFPQRYENLLEEYNCLGHKYKNRFLDHTLFLNLKRRWSKQYELLENCDG